jgi:hypothetical protein
MYKIEEIIYESGNNIYGCPDNIYVSEENIYGSGKNIYDCMENIHGSQKKSIWSEFEIFNVSYPHYSFHNDK